MPCILGRVNSLSPKEAFDLRKSRTLKLLTQLRELSVAEDSSRDNLVLRKLQKLLAIAQTSPWWRQKFKPYKEDLDSSSTLAQLLGSLPTLSRSEIKEHGQWMSTWIPGTNAAEYEVSSSSGSTGKPVSVVKFLPVQKFEYDAVELMDLGWHRVDLNKPFLVYTAREEPEVNPSNPGEPLSYVGATGRITTKTIHKTPVSEVIELLRSEPFESMLTSAGTLRDFLVSAKDLDPSSHSLKQVLTFADRVDLGLRELARDVLGVKILDRYSTSEVGPIAIQCPHFEHLHALQSLNYVEILDINNRPCGSNQVGRVVVTALGSWGMPLIRYEIGDTASWGEPCDSDITLPVLSPEIVRIRESYIDDRGAIRNIMPDKANFIKLPALRDFQLIMFTDKQVLLLVGDVALTSGLLAEIEIDLEKVTGKRQPVDVLVIPKLEWLERNKRQSVVQIDEAAPLESSFDAYRKFVN
jgi:phenylacetate-CoA ligase